MQRLFRSVGYLSVFTLTALDSTTLLVNIAQQKIYVIQKGSSVKKYAVSTSGYGVGGELNSYKTPLGKHRLHRKIGNNAPSGTIFKSSINTKKITFIHVDFVPPEQQYDTITTRIIQLEGLEKRNIHSFPRGIWIHGTPFEGNIGIPCSHGCIRMRNKDIIELFEIVHEGMFLNIVN